MTPNHEIIVTEEHKILAERIVELWSKEELISAFAKLIAVANKRKEELDGEIHDERIYF